MNIVTPIPTTLVFNTANVNTESARRDNVQRETIPQTTESEQSSAEQGLGSESDRVRTAGQPPSPVTYERPQVSDNAASQQESTPDNAEQESAGREEAENQQQQQAQQREIEELERRDAEVRAHEQAHAATGGQYASSPQYDYETGPDGRRYAVGGQVSIDISEEQTPEQTIRKMQQVRAAALAPAEPSPQDLQVAAEASRKAFEARAELAEDNQQALQIGEEPPSPLEESIPSLDEIVDANDISPPSRTLDRATLETDRLGVSPSENNEDDNSVGFGEPTRRNLDIDDSTDAQLEPGFSQSQVPSDPRGLVIQQFYQAVSEPRAQGFSASA